MRVQEGLGLGACEDAGRGTDGPDAAGADGAGQCEAADLVPAVEQAGDIAGVEGVAAARRVDEIDRVCPEPEPMLGGYGDRAELAPGDDDAPGAHFVERERLTNRVVLGIIASAFVNGLAVLMSVYHPGNDNRWFGVFFAAGFGIAALIGAYLAWSIFRSRHR